VDLAEDTTEYQQSWEELVADLIAEAERTPDPRAKAGCLRDAAVVYEQHLEDASRALIAYQAAFAADPGDEEGALALERVTESLGLWHQVLPECEALLATVQEPPARAALLTWLARWADRFGSDDSNVESRLQEAASLVPGSAPVAEALSALHRARGDWARAAEVLERAAGAAEDPQDSVGLLLEAARLIQIHVGDGGRAASLYRRVLALQPGSTAAAEALAEFSDQAVDPSALCEEYRLAHEIDPDNLTVVRQWADLAFKHQRWDDVRRLFDDLYTRAGGPAAQPSSDSRTRLNQALDRFVAGKRWSEAIGVLATLAGEARGPTQARYLVAAGKIAEHELHDDSAAIEHYQRALEAAPEDIKTFDRIYGILSARHAWIEVEAHLRRLIDRLRADGRGDEAAVMLPLWRRLGEVYRLGLRNLTGAAEAYRECTRLAPSDRFVKLVADLIEPAEQRSTGS
jgi:tetratricopeptide (TPR) repeat protein